MSLQIPHIRMFRINSGRLINHVFSCNRGGNNGPREARVTSAPQARKRPSQGHHTVESLAEELHHMKNA